MSEIDLINLHSYFILCLACLDLACIKVHMNVQAFEVDISNQELVIS